MISYLSFLKASIVKPEMNISKKSKSTNPTINICPHSGFFILLSIDTKNIIPKCRHTPRKTHIASFLMLFISQFNTVTSIIVVTQV